MQGIERELARELAEKFEFDIKSVIPYRDTFIIDTGSGKKILKRTSMSPERVDFIHGAKEHLYKNGFKNIDRYICDESGKPFMDVNGEIFLITDFIEGRECNFLLREDMVKATKALALLHKASRGYTAEKVQSPWDETGKLPVNFTKRLEEIKKLKKAAKKGKSLFDFIFLQHVDYYYELGEETLKELNSSGYLKLCEESRREGIICHHDYMHSNIICSEAGLSVINFDFCCYELKIYDLSNLIRRKMRKCSWDLDEAGIIIDKYNEIEKIDDTDFLVMKLLIQFPQKFWRVTNKFYNSRRSWSEKIYIPKLQEVIDEIEPHRRFMERFDELKPK